MIMIMSLVLNHQRPPQPRHQKESSRKQKRMVSSLHRNRTPSQCHPMKEEKERRLSRHHAVLLLKCVFKWAVYAIMALPLTHAAPLLHVDDAALLAGNGARFHRVGNDA